MFDLEIMTFLICGAAAILDCPIWSPGGKISLSLGYVWKALAMTIRSRNLIKLHKTEQFFSQASQPDVKVGHEWTNCAGSRIGTVTNIGYRARYQNLNLDTSCMKPASGWIRAWISNYIYM